MANQAGIMALASGLLLAACSAGGVRTGTEEPPYTVTEQVGAVEIRHYGSRVAAQTVLDMDAEPARNAGFRRLAGYIFGGNVSQTKIAMTAPVAQSSEKIAMTAPVAQAQDAQGRQVIRFFMPEGSTLESLPKPNDPAVELVAVAPETMAVLRFSGDRGAVAVIREQASLLAALQGGAWQQDGAPVAWFYDPPWTLWFLRRNEVAVPVRPAAGRVEATPPAIR